MPARTQNHHQRQVHAAPQKPHRHGRHALATGVAAKAESAIEVRCQFDPASTGLAGVIRPVKPSTTGTTCCLCQLGLVLIDLEEEGKKTGVFRQSVEHWDGLKVW